jgi:[acyl-carrier-protein] S-malonyltransferase
MSLAFVFPGQGSQRPGMGRRWVEADPTLFDDASDVTGLDVRHLVCDADAGELQPTGKAQVATAVCGLAAWRALRSAGIVADVVAGHSLGELTALVAAGCLDERSGMALVGARGRAMAGAAAAQPGTMVALLGCDLAEAEAACASTTAPIGVANVNAPDQIVLAGSADGIRAATAAARRPGVRVVSLPVGGAFHSLLMAGALGAFALALSGTRLRDADVPVVCNVDGRPRQRAGELLPLLVAQLCSPVQWGTCVQTLRELGVDRIVEVGPGGVLTRLIRRQLHGVETLSVGDPDDVGRVATGVVASAAAQH